MGEESPPGKGATGSPYAPPTFPPDLAALHAHRMRLAEERESALAQWRAAFDSVSCATLIFDREFRVLQANSASARLLGLPVTEIVGKSSGELFRSAPRIPHEPLLVQARMAHAHGEAEVQSAEGGEWFHLSVDPIFNTRGEWLGVVQIITDITARKRAERELQESEARYRTLFEQAAEAITLIDPVTGRMAAFNDRAHGLLGYTREEFQSLRIPDVEFGVSTEDIARRIERLLQRGVDEFEIRCRTKAGEERFILISARMVSLGGRKMIQSVARDVTDRKRLEGSVDLLAVTDELTGLHNRRGFLTVATHLLKIARHRQRDAVMLFLDLIGFRRLTQQFGHREGDRLVREIARVLRGAVGEADLIGRVGGDEFAVLIVDPEGVEPAGHVERLRQQIARRNRDSAGTAVWANLGAVRYDPDAPCSAEELLRLAESEMRRDRKRSPPA